MRGRTGARGYRGEVPRWTRLADRRVVHTSQAVIVQPLRRHRGAFDYLYLPMDFERGQNRGFAFVNFITPRGVPNFYEEFHGHPLTESSANRRVEIIFADVQGKEENLRESARYRPACFVSDGSHRREM